MTRYGYIVNYYDSFKHFTDGKTETIHTPFSSTNYILQGVVEQGLNTISSFNFSIGVNHPCFLKIKNLIGVVEVINAWTSKRLFLGRVLESNKNVSGDDVSINYICEDFLGFMHDSVQTYRKFSATTGIRTFLKNIIDYHNSQTEDYKKIMIGTVDVTSNSDVEYRYTDYEDTFDTIKHYLIDLFGGYIISRFSEGVFYIDYLKEVGMHHDKKISVGDNIVSLKHNINSSDIITRIVPIGGDIDDGDNEEVGNNPSRRLTISDVNSGNVFLEDPDLVAEFGIIQKSIDWTEINDPEILKDRGEQFLRQQKIALSSFEIDVIDKELANNGFVGFEVGDYYLVDSKFSAAEEVQITGKKIDLLSPHKNSITLGKNNQSLSYFQNQQKEAEKSIQKFQINVSKKNKEIDSKFNSTMEQISNTQKELTEKITSVNNENSLTSLKNQLSQFNSLLNTEQANLSSLNSELKRIKGIKTTTANEISLVELQISLSTTKIDNYKSIINEINLKISEVAN